MKISVKIQTLDASAFSEIVTEEYDSVESCLHDFGFKMRSGQRSIVLRLKTCGKIILIDHITQVIVSEFLED